MKKSNSNQALLDFISASPTPYHAVQNMLSRLVTAGFIPLKESDAWDLQQGKRYVLTRNDSSVIAFVYGKEDIVSNGIRMVGAHTDSPCLRVKPNADIYSKGYWQVGVEVYGGVLLNPWFDRPLSLAGKISVADEKHTLHHVLIDFKDEIGMIPSLAIHLNRDANKANPINAQKDLPVLLGVGTAETQSLKNLLLKQVEKQHPTIRAEKVLDYELSFYDMQQGCSYGVNKDFISSSRLDNLLSCYVGLQAILSSTGQQSGLLICSDHEEVGSESAAGAAGSFMSDFLHRLLPNSEDRIRAIKKSLLISADNAHGVHPNYADMHDSNHGPLLNAGPVIKVNANQRYASNTETQSLFRHLCDANNIPVQSFVVRSDMACGSTIGPITATNLGVRTLDIGVPTFSMHSIRESAGSRDTVYLFKALKAFYAMASLG